MFYFNFWTYQFNVWSNIKLLNKFKIKCTQCDCACWLIVQKGLFCFSFSALNNLITTYSNQQTTGSTTRITKTQIKNMSHLDYSVGDSFSKYLLSSEKKCQEHQLEKEYEGSRINENQSLLLETTEFMANPVVAQTRQFSDVKPHLNAHQNLKPQYLDIFENLEVTVGNIQDQGLSDCPRRKTRDGNANYEIENCSPISPNQDQRSGQIQQLQTICHSLLLANKQLVFKMDKIQKENSSKQEKEPKLQKKQTMAEQNIKQSIQNTVKNSLETQLPFESITRPTKHENFETIKPSYDHALNIPAKYITQQMEFILNQYKSQIITLKQQLSLSKQENKQNITTLKSYKQEVKMLKKTISCLQTECQSLRQNNMQLKDKLVRNIRERSQTKFTTNNMPSSPLAKLQAFQETACFGDLRQTQVKEYPYTHGDKFVRKRNRSKSKQGSHRTEWGSPYAAQKKAATYQNLGQLEKYSQEHLNKQRMENKSPSQTPCPVPNYIKFKNKFTEEQNKNSMRMIKGQTNPKIHMQQVKEPSPHQVAQNRVSKLLSVNNNVDGLPLSPGGKNVVKRVKTTSSDHLIHQNLDEIFDMSSHVTQHQDHEFQKYIVSPQESSHNDLPQLTLVTKTSKKQSIADVKGSSCQRIIEIDSEDASSTKTQKISANKSGNKYTQSDATFEEENNQNTINMNEKTSGKRTYSKQAMNRDRNSNPQSNFNGPNNKAISSFKQVNELQRFREQSTRHFQSECVNHQPSCQHHQQYRFRSKNQVTRSPQPGRALLIPSSDKYCFRKQVHPSSHQNLRLLEERFYQSPVAISRSPNESSLKKRLQMSQGKIYQGKI